MLLTVEKRVAITLWRLGTNIEYRSLSQVFGIGLSTVCVVVADVCTTTTVVENAFGRLQGRWCSLMKQNDTDIRFLPTLATA